MSVVVVANQVPVELFDSSGNTILVQNGQAIPANTKSILLAGSDGTNARNLELELDGSNYRVRTGSKLAAGSNLAGKFQLRNPGDSADLGDASNPIRIDPTGTTTQPVSVSSLPLPAGGATEATLSGVKDNQESSIDSGNSSTSQLAIDGVFTGTGVEVTDYSSITVAVHSDESSIVDGLEFQFSINDSNWDFVDYHTFDITVTESCIYEIPVAAKYFRVKYTNGDTATTEFRIQTILHRLPIALKQVKSGSNVAACQSGFIIATQTDENVYKWLQSNDDGRLKVVTGEQSDDPLHVIVSTGQRSYYHLNLVDADEPAEIDSGANEPYDVGGDTLTISVNGSSQGSTFSTRAAQPGIHYSAPHPPTLNPNTHKLKVSVDGGALEEVQIGKGWTTGAAIAAALQSQIRTNIENGTNVTVEYNTSEYPFRYVFKSGTTGSSSSIHLEKGGDDFAKLFFLGAFGGTERIGLNADNYWTYEVIEQLLTDLTDVTVFQEGTGVHIQTVAGGSSASLQVTAGGANTALQFPTTLVNGVTGSGSDDLAVDGSTSAVRFSVIPSTNEEFVVSKFEFFIRDNGAALNKFGGQDPLTNGVKIEVKSENLPIIPVLEAKTNADLMTQLDEGVIVDNGFTTGGQDLVKCTFDMSPGLRIVSGGQTNIYVTVQDDLSVLDGTFTVRARGWIEAE